MKGNKFFKERMKMRVDIFFKKKAENKKITVLTCYDYTSARILSRSEIDCLLVGDSVAMTMHGCKDTVAATLQMMQFHVQAVSRGAENKFIIADLPFLSYRKSKKSNIEAVQILMQAGAQAIKLEGASGNLKLITHLVESGIPIMGHLGLTPQFVHQFGGYKVQGKTLETAAQIKQDALALQEAGCFSVVLECIPQLLAKEITEMLSIPTIGIGAGPDTDGQVLVWQDFLGLNSELTPKFVKHFLNGEALFQTAIQDFIQAVNNKEFPEHEHCY